jgi:P-type Cu+ transporter
LPQELPISYNDLHERGVPLGPDAGEGQNSGIFVALAGRFLGTLQVADTLRPEAIGAIQALKSMGMRTVLLTGDAKTIAEEVGHTLGVDEIVPELLPEDKLSYVKRMTEKGRKVVMVGDGVNDAPALMQATVGVAMGSGTKVARESADAVLIGSDLSKLIDVLQTARRCRRTIMQNFVGTLAVDYIGIVLAAFGSLNPLLAAFRRQRRLPSFLEVFSRHPPQGTTGEATTSWSEVEAARANFRCQAANGKQNSRR